MAGDVRRDWLNSAVFYQVYPQSFYDSNGDGIGDLPGVIEKLDYVKHLGCNAIWINPCFVSPFGDAGYDVSDYYRVAPRYGANDDLRRLTAAARERGLRVLLDLVVGHTSIEHPWFKASCKHDPNEFANRYIWTNTPWRLGDGYNNLIRGYGERPGCFMPNYFWFQPALNYGFAKRDPSATWQLPPDHPDCLATREAVKSIMRFWLDMGVAGFRVDMAMSLVKEDEGWVETTALWRDMREMLDREYPGTALIAEWSSPRHAVAAGFDADFVLDHGGVYGSLFHFDDHELVEGREPQKHSFFRRCGEGDISVFLREHLDHYEAIRGAGHVALYSGNHDIYRAALGRTEEEMKVLFAFLLTMPGLPFIYYGDEIGMAYVRGLKSKEGGYDRTGSRTPMQWDGGPNAGFSTAPAERLYLPVDPSADRPTAAGQLGVEGSLLETVRSLIALRRSRAALGGRGDFRVVHAAPNETPLVYERRLGDDRVLVAVNPAERPAAAAVDVSGTLRPLLAAGVRVGEGGVLALDGVSYGVFAVE